MLFIILVGVSNFCLRRNDRNVYKRGKGSESMTRSRKMSGKLTTKQLHGVIQENQVEFRSFAKALVEEVMKHNTLIYALLDDMNKMEKIICENCKEEVARPILKGIANNDECPSCKRSLFIKTQVSLDDLQKASQKVNEEE